MSLHEGHFMYFRVLSAELRSLLPEVEIIVVFFMSWRCLFGHLLAVIEGKSGKLVDDTTAEVKFCKHWVYNHVVLISFHE